jgi:predicted RNA-binding protein with RPS1 domain
MPEEILNKPTESGQENAAAPVDSAETAVTPAADSHEESGAAETALSSDATPAPEPAAPAADVVEEHAPSNHATTDLHGAVVADNMAQVPAPASSPVATPVTSPSGSQILPLTESLIKANIEGDGPTSAMSAEEIANYGGDAYSSTFPSLHEGDVVQGVVVHIDREGVLVDVGTKSEGIIRRNELSRDTSIPAEEIVKVGERIDVYVMEAENQDGNLILSKKRADFEKAWEKVQEAKDENRTLFAMVTDRVKGGLVVDLGIRGFVPASHVGNGSMKNNLERYVGQSIPLKVIEVDKERRKVVLSNKLAADEERVAKKAETVSSLQVNQTRHGVVRRLTNYGAFIDLGGIDGLLHISEMSWTRIAHPQEVLREGQELDVVVLKMDLEAGRVSLGLRQILPDPWTGIDTRYAVGDVITGSVSRIVPFGAFVQVEGGVEGIIPKGGKSGPNLTQGQEVEVKIVDMRPEERKMTLSLRSAKQEEEPKPARREAEETAPARVEEEPRFTIGDAFRAQQEATPEPETSEPEAETPEQTTVPEKTDENKSEEA